jgi:molybdopterin-guanine dinucleotide biosynthesis protein A
MSLLGVVMAGGRNTRFGDLKAFAEVAGVPIIERVIGALRAVTDDVVLSANDADAYAATGLPARADVLPELGALGGIHAALLWAQERGHTGIVAVACDMPFPSQTLLQTMVGHAAQYDVVVPESDGRRGVEPLFAYYSVRCLPAIDLAIARADRRMIGFHADVSVLRVPLAEVRAHGDPAVMFMNVNTRADLEQAEHIAQKTPA